MRPLDDLAEFSRELDLGHPSHDLSEALDLKQRLKVALHGVATNLCATS